MESSHPAQQPIGLIYTKPLKTGLKPNVLTNDKPVGPFSFFDPKNFKEKEHRPDVPCYLTPDELFRPLVTEKEKVFAGWEIQKNGDLKFTDSEVKKKQSGVLFSVIKDAASKLMDGKGIVGLSLPVKIFETRSIIERLCDLFTYSSHYLNQAAACQKPEDRIKFILGSVFAACPLGLGQLKPFNPLLGETYQATLADGTTIECEHISHHPPISYFYVKSKEYKIYGHITINGHIHANSLDGANEGWYTVEFNDGKKFKFCLPSMNIWGLLMGTRGLQIKAAIVVLDEATKTKGVLKFAADMKTGLTSMFTTTQHDIVRGLIYRYDEAKHQQVIKKHHDKWLVTINDLAHMSDVKEEIFKLEGSWLRELRCGGELLWSLDRDLKNGQPHVWIDNPLPSDVRFREDLICLIRKNEELSQTWKTKLEEQQRHERALRKKCKDSSSSKHH